MRALRALFLIAVLAAAAPAAAASYKGVTVPDSVRAEGATLKLNGFGVRKKLGFSVYLGSLYLSTPTRDARAAVRADEPKRVSLRFLRDVPFSSLKEAFDDGFFKNSQEKLDALRARIETLYGYLAAGAREGQEVTFTYLPAVGTRVAVGDQDKGTIPGKDFMEALWAVWLGDLPASKDLKNGMLGGA